MSPIWLSHWFVGRNDWRNISHMGNRSALSIHWSCCIAYYSRLLSRILSAWELLVRLELTLRLPLIAVLSLLSLRLLIIPRRSTRIECAGIVARRILWLGWGRWSV
jgi:hypothetical protein